MKTPVVISLCDYTGNMVEPWAEAGCICICVDLQHSIRATARKAHRIKKYESGGEIHFLWGDARSWKPSDFDRNFNRKYEIVFVACFPVCTQLSGSGSQDWGNKKRDPLKGIPLLLDGLMLFNACEQIADWSGAPYCIENPAGCIPTHHRKHDYTFHPWNYGDDYQKLTCLWVGNGFIMPEFTVTKKPDTVTQKIWLETPGEERANKRSETPEGFARAVFESNSKQIKEEKLIA